ncbi:hypothetical protein DWX58_02200 [Pseudoflavonifractor sp. AF19-9AC]|uniref:flavodoxin family protein BilS n=1 Tax=Pseudoflavonifractor sp. AF19-9AC TaxID=2292244 RepID=UPI000E48F5D5|nr:flavodoxin family protein BilS [Pseudoflavonifractor sp. AF19-9AC]RHR11280.1 hypothetical protein DWX58_02200 [Pseudoflavonifractor sp. AF19-9AC]
MKYAIVYSSKTGNTKLLAQAIGSALPPEDCLYFGPPSPEALTAQRVYVGFWTDKGTCDGETQSFLSSLTNQEVFLFGTAGFGGAPAYFEKILSSVQAHVPASAHVLGGYMCQGKMPQAVRQRYEAMEDSPRRTAMLENFDRALSHPDHEDLDGVKKAVQVL